MGVVGEAASGRDALDLVQRQPCDVVVLDITMPGMSGLEVLRQIRTLYPRLPVLILSVHPAEQFGVHAIKAGASGYLLKESAPDELTKAIRRVVEGRSYVSSRLAEVLAESVQRGSGAPHENLTQREFEILRLIGAGRTVSEIAESLEISVKTVSTYRARILEKMDLRTTAELTRYAIVNKIA
jgi:DNA-binding NarL/FixJ family response regulator